MSGEDIKVMISPSRIIVTVVSMLIIAVCGFVWAEIQNTEVKVQAHEVRLSVEEQNTETFKSQLGRIEDKIDMVLETR